MASLFPAPRRSLTLKGLRQTCESAVSRRPRHYRLHLNACGEALRSSGPGSLRRIRALSDGVLVTISQAKRCIWPRVLNLALDAADDKNLSPTLTIKRLAVTAASELPIWLLARYPFVSFRHNG